MTWSLTDVFGRALFRLPYGNYEVKAEKEGLGYSQKVTLLMNEHKEVILNLQQVSGFEAMPFDIPPELGAGTKIFLLLPVAILTIYGLTLLFKQPKRKWKYSYLK